MVVGVPSVDFDWFIAAVYGHFEVVGVGVVRADVYVVVGVFLGDGDGGFVVGKFFGVFVGEGVGEGFE